MEEPCVPMMIKMQEIEDSFRFWFLIVSTLLCIASGNRKTQNATMTVWWPVKADCMGLNADDAMFKLSHQYGLR
jgi:hypothetical protein